MRSPTCPDSRLDNRKYVLDLIVCTRSRRANFCLQFVRCAEHFILQVFLTSATESTIHCAKAETSRRYNSCTSQYPNYLLTSHGLTRAVLVVSNTSKARLACQRSPWTRSHWSQKILYPYVFSLQRKEIPHSRLALRGIRLLLDTHAFLAQVEQHRLCPTLQTLNLKPWTRWWK